MLSNVCFYMKTRISPLHKSILIIFLVLFADQALKIWIKTNFFLGEHIRVADWFFIYFIENNGMAFGVELFSKIFLTLFRIVAVIFIGYFIYSSIKKEKYPFGFIAAVSFIFAGALGNIIDSVFYGLIFSESSVSQVASFMPEAGGYAPVFYGKVVDMFYFPIIQTTLPNWLPFWGGNEFVFFSPIFNLADSSITIGVFIIFLFYRFVLNEKQTNTENETIE